MLIDYDPNKNQRNIRERNLSFELAKHLDWRTAFIWEDARFEYPEQRLSCLAFLDKRLHYLYFTRINSGIRVISFRKANKREIKKYESPKAFTC